MTLILVLSPLKLIPPLHSIRQVLPPTVHVLVRALHRSRTHCHHLRWVWSVFGVLLSYGTDICWFYWNSCSSCPDFHPVLFPMIFHSNFNHHSSPSLTFPHRIRSSEAQEERDEAEHVWRAFHGRQKEVRLWCVFCVIFCHGILWWNNSLIGRLPVFDFVSPHPFDCFLD